MFLVLWSFKLTFSISKINDNKRNNLLVFRNGISIYSLDELYSEAVSLEEAINEEQTLEIFDIINSFKNYDIKNETLKKEIEQDRLAHGKKPLKDKNDYQPPASGGNGSENLEASEEIPSGVKTQKSSITESGKRLVSKRGA